MCWPSTSLVGKTVPIFLSSSVPTCRRSPQQDLLLTSPTEEGTGRVRGLSHRQPAVAPNQLSVCSTDLAAHDPREWLEVSKLGRAVSTLYIDIRVVMLGILGDASSIQDFPVWLLNALDHNPIPIVLSVSLINSLVLWGELCHWYLRRKGGHCLCLPPGKEFQ